MPDVWTNHPEIVRDLLKEAGFRCGVEGRFLKGRDPAWTCAFDGVLAIMAARFSPRRSTPK